MKIICAMPTRGLIFTKVEVALEDELFKNGQMPFILRTDNLPIPDCRNKLIESALSVPDWTHILLIDDDVIIPEGGLGLLIEADSDIAFIDYPMHYTGDRWGNMGTATYDDWLPGEDPKGKPVAWAGLGCTLVKREVLEKMSDPYFKVTQHTFTRDDNGHITLNDDNVQLGGGGEDTYFFVQAKKLGLTITPIQDVQAGHARLKRAVLATQEGKYQMQHEIAVNGLITRQYK